MVAVVFMVPVYATESVSMVPSLSLKRISMSMRLDCILLSSTFEFRFLCSQEKTEINSEAFLCMSNVLEHEFILREGNMIL